MGGVLKISAVRLYPKVKEEPPPPPPRAGGPAGSEVILVALLYTFNNCTDPTGKGGCVYV
jgi:hypothetical protein